MRLRTKGLAATLAAGAKNLAATRGRLAREKAVTAGTHEIAGLESPLHIVLEFKPRCVTRTNKKGRLRKATAIAAAR